MLLHIRVFKHSNQAIYIFVIYLKDVILALSWEAKKYRKLNARKNTSYTVHLIGYFSICPKSYTAFLTKISVIHFPI